MIVNTIAPAKRSYDHTVPQKPVSWQICYELKGNNLFYARLSHTFHEALDLFELLKGINLLFKTFYLSIMNISKLNLWLKP